MIERRQQAFWDLADVFLAREGVDEGTLMGNRCLRVRGEFLATIHRRTGDLVLKMNADRIAELIEDGTGREFAPAGRVFKEWVAIASEDTELWETLITEVLSEGDAHQ